MTMATQAAPGVAQILDPNRDGALVIRRSIQINAQPERIWREFETFERFAAWWTTSQPDRREGVSKYELRIGARVEMPCEWDASPDGSVEAGSCIFAGNVVRIEPARELTFELSVEGAGWDAPTFVTIRLSPNAYGTLVEILHYGFENIGPAAVEQFSGFEGGWDLRELRALRAIVEAAA
jgi:uncharacterized protein YndB with AHSA1/START domain